MKCLQCKESATVTGMFDGVTIIECAAGHRTGQLSVKQTADVNEKLGIGATEATESGKLKIVKAKKGKRTNQAIERPDCDNCGHTMPEHSGLSFCAECDCDGFVIPESAKARYSVVGGTK